MLSSIENCDQCIVYDKQSLQWPAGYHHDIMRNSFVILRQPRSRSLRARFRSMMTSKIRVGLVLSHSLSCCREILRGIRTFALERPEWLLTPIFPDSRAVQLAASLKCYGYIAHIFEQSLADTLLATKRPDKCHRAEECPAGKRFQHDLDRLP